MRLVPATKREIHMSDRKLLFLMNAEQAQESARLHSTANRGDGGAACRLGDMYRERLGGLRYSPKKTFRWYARSAMAGDANGQNNLGACYEHGLGCEQSYVKAVKWYRLSAAKKLRTASMNLGYCYLRGKGLPADKGEALRLFRLAVEQGEDKARREVERLEGPMKKPQVRFIDATIPGRNFGLIGVAGVRPSEPHPESRVADQGDEGTR
jgi:TPR repeat protein